MPVPRHVNCYLNSMSAIGYAWGHQALPQQLEPYAMPACPACTPGGEPHARHLPKPSLEGRRLCGQTWCCCCCWRRPTQQTFPTSLTPPVLPAR